MKNWRSTFLRLAAAVVSLAVRPAAAEPEIKFPIVFSSKKELQKLGIFINIPAAYDTSGSDDPNIRNKCYHYGEGMQHNITISDEFLARYVAKGFSRRSLCMALVSEARFDPETGKRLPTYIFKSEVAVQNSLEYLNPKTLRPDVLAMYVPDIFKTIEAMTTAVENARRGNFAGLSEDEVGALLGESGAISAELPLAVPNCFKNGTPYLDCRWRYGMMSGRKLSAAAPVKYREVGEALDRHIKDAIKNGGFPPDRPEEKEGRLKTDGGFSAGLSVPYEGKTVDLRVPSELVPWTGGIEWFDVSPEFPNGYGYAFNADGSLGPGVSASAILAAHDGTRQSSRISESRILNVVKRN